MAGLQVSASQFFIFILFTFVANLAMLALFRSLASSNRHEPKGQKKILLFPKNRSLIFYVVLLRSYYVRWTIDLGCCYLRWMWVDCSRVVMLQKLICLSFLRLYSSTFYAPLVPMAIIRSTRLVCIRSSHCQRIQNSQRPLFNPRSVWTRLSWYRSSESSLLYSWCRRRKCDRVWICLLGYIVQLLLLECVEKFGNHLWVLYLLLGRQSHYYRM